MHLLKICWNAKNRCNVTVCSTVACLVSPYSSVEVSSPCKANYLTLTQGGRVAGRQGIRDALDIEAVCNLEKQWSSGPDLMWELETPLTPSWSCREVATDARTTLKSKHSHTHNETLIIRLQRCWVLSLDLRPQGLDSVSLFLLSFNLYHIYCFTNLLSWGLIAALCTSLRGERRPRVIYYYSLSTNQALWGHVQPNVDKLESTI